MVRPAGDAKNNEVGQKQIVGITASAARRKLPFWVCLSMDAWTKTRVDKDARTMSMALSFQVDTPL